MVKQSKNSRAGYRMSYEFVSSDRRGGTLCIISQGWARAQREWCLGVRAERTKKLS